MTEQLDKFVKHMGYTRPLAENARQAEWDAHWKTWQAATAPANEQTPADTTPAPEEENRLTLFGIVLPEPTPADEKQALREMLDDARYELEQVREALGVSYEPHQSLFERLLESARAKAAPAKTAKQLYEGIEQVLLHYSLSNLEDTRGGSYQLVDHLCAPDAHTIESGQHEIRLIVDEIYNEVLTKAAPDVAADARNADTGRLDFVIDRKTTWYPERARDGSGRGILCYASNGGSRVEVVGATMRDALDAAMAASGVHPTVAADEGSDVLTHAAFAWHDSPENTGVGTFCQPGDRRDPRWVLMFDDADRGHLVYESLQEARKGFAQAEGRGWNCWLLSPTPRAAIPANVASLRRVLQECVDRLQHVQDEAYAAVSGWALRTDTIEKAVSLLKASAGLQEHVNERKELAKSVFGGITALRWLLNITTEFDRKDVRTRQAARLLDDYTCGNGTNREHLERLWKTLHDELTLHDALECLNAGKQEAELLQPGGAVPRVFKDHEVAATVNQLRDIAVAYHGAQQLRERIAQVVVPLMTGGEAPISAVAAG